MYLLDELVGFQSGTPQFRISESAEPFAPVYDFYTQTNLEIDLLQTVISVTDKQVRTMDDVTLLDTGDVLFSLISGRAVRVQAIHKGRLYTQNYVKLIPRTGVVDANYLVYLLNEDVDIIRQLSLGLQGSQVLKYTVKQLKNLRLSSLPSLKQQQLIGNIYQQTHRLTTLKKQIADNEYRLILAKLSLFV